MGGGSSGLGGSQRGLTLGIHPEREEERQSQRKRGWGRWEGLLLEARGFTRYFLSTS